MCAVSCLVSCKVPARWVLALESCKKYLFFEIEKLFCEFFLIITKFLCFFIEILSAEKRKTKIWKCLNYKRRQPHWLEYIIRGISVTSKKCIATISRKIWVRMERAAQFSTPPAVSKAFPESFCLTWAWARWVNLFFAFFSHLVCFADFPDLVGSNILPQFFRSE